MAQRKRAKGPSKKIIIFHQQNPPPGKLNACGVLEDYPNLSTPERNLVNCLDCLSRPDPTIVVR